MGKKFVGLNGLKYFWNKIKVKIEEAQKTVSDKIAEVENSLTAETTARENADKTLQANIENKVDKVNGKGLSTNDYTTEEKNKLAGLSNYNDSAVKTLIANEAKAREDADKALQTAIDGKAAASHTHDDRYYTETEINEKLYDINEKIGTLQENKNDLLDMCSDLYDKVADETSLRTEADTALQNQITANKSAIDTLNGTGTGSVKKTVSDEIAKVVANAPGDFDTLKEISDWIDTHEDSASAMNTAISTNATNLSNHITNKSNPHSVTKAQVGLGNVGNFKAVSTVASQELTDTEKSNARTNIGAGTSSFSGSYDDLTDKPSSFTPASHNHSASNITSGTLPIARGGTGQTTQAGINKAFVGGLEEGTSDVTDGTMFVSSYASDNGFADTNATNVPYKRKFSHVWNYIKGKADSVYAKLSHTHTKAQITDFPTSLKNPNALTVNGKTYDGSSAVDAGVQTVANGGTGATTAKDAFVNIANGLLEGAGPEDTEHMIFQNSNGKDWGRYKFYQFWEYIKGKISSVLGLTASNYGGKASTAGTADKATKDGNGNNIVDTYATKTELESVIAGDISSKMNTANPEGTGSFSLNRYTDKENGIGEHSVSMGDDCGAMGEASVALGYSTFAHNTGSIAEGFVTHSRGVGSHAEGKNTNANGDSSHAEGESTTASGTSSHAEGESTEATGNYAHAEGYSTHATGNYAHAEGSGTIASNGAAHAEGYNCTASGTASHAEGYNCTASKDVAHAEGMYTTATGQTSHTSGYYTQTTNFAEFACGQFNKSTKSDNISERTIFSVGNGNSETDRFNALEVKDNGDVYAKKLYVGRYGSEVHEVLHSGNMTFDEATATLTITV